MRGREERKEGEERGGSFRIERRERGRRERKVT